MAKDPAFLFYPNDYIGGTMGMTFEEKGAYVELLMCQFNRGHMTYHMCGQVVGQILDKIIHKFEKDENGLYYNVRLEQEINKRKAYSESRKNNITGKNQYTKSDAHMDGHTTSHMENENENINSNKKGSNYLEEDKQIFEEFRKLYKGTKRGLDIEFDNFRKKHSDWKEVNITLKDCLNKQIKAREINARNKKFVPQWKNLQTYINNRSWEEEIAIEQNLFNTTERYIMPR